MCECQYCADRGEKECPLSNAGAQVDSTALLGLNGGKMSHEERSKLTEPVENPYELPEGWVAVPLSLIQRAKDMTMDICNSHTGHCPEEIYCPQIYASTARELNDALRNVLEEHKPNISLHRPEGAKEQP